MCINASLPHTTLTGMQEKLLNKPPFRYLHDIVMAIRKQTGFLEGLFDEDQMVGKAIKDKHAKVAFLERLILCVGHFYGQPMEAQPRKIVAGTLFSSSSEECKPCWLYLISRAYRSTDANNGQLICFSRKLNRYGGQFDQ